MSFPITDTIFHMIDHCENKLNECAIKRKEFSFLFEWHWQCRLNLTKPSG